MCVANYGGKTRIKKGLQVLRNDLRQGKEETLRPLARSPEASVAVKVSLEWRERRKRQEKTSPPPQPSPCTSCMSYNGREWKELRHGGDSAPGAIGVEIPSGAEEGLGDSCPLLLLWFA